MNYRAEIDGLRAFAVVPVILFHAGVPFFNGGYVGVDVFFVISGYLITSILIKDLEHSRYSILSFYERRARRILPALFFVLGITYVLSLAFLLPHDFDRFTGSLWAVSLFASNFYFWRESGYFDSGVELKPLLHTWSLAVEEQYYIFFPLLLALLWSRKKDLTIFVLILIAISSLLLSEFLSHFRPEANYYLLPTRAWEILIGSLASIYMLNRTKRIFPKPLNEGLALLGLMMILFAVVRFDEHTPFPGLWGLIPCLGTALILLFAEQNTFCGRFLATRLLVFIGLLSYSAYLWHQPLLAFIRYSYFGKYEDLLLTGMCFVTFALAYLSWKFIEAPFRNRKRTSNRQILYFSLGGICLFVFLGCVTSNQTVFQKLVPENSSLYASYMGYSNTQEWVIQSQMGKCFLTSGSKEFSNFDMKDCLHVADNKLNVLLLGDSHAAHWHKALASNSDTYNVMQATASGCRPLLPVEGAKRCTDIHKYIFDKFLPSSPHLDRIVLSGLWQEEDLPKLKPTIEYLGQFTNEIVVLGPTVQYKIDLPLLLTQASRFGYPTSAIARMIDEESKTIDIKMKAMLNNVPARYLSVIDVLCTGRSVCLSTTPNGIPIAYDRGHFTLTGSMFTLARMGY